MEIIPAIDIRDGKCVRLYQGNYSRQTTYDKDPVEVALKWKSQGATWLHIIDLNGAATGSPKNMAIIKNIMQIGDLQIELGGGLRQEKVIVDALLEGIKRVILSTIVIENPALVRNLCLNFGDAVVVALDAREGKVSIHGWQDDTIIDVLFFARQAMKLGVTRFIYTDIQRDGTLSEPNFDAIEQLIRDLNLPIIASGGICNLEHIRKLKTIGADAVIIGKALYTGDISLREAIIESGG
jgi:phosphoribosylformimino-5-aminoimidazole carboxamide ribotide isomerase